MARGDRMAPNWTKWLCGTVVLLAAPLAAARHLPEKNAAQEDPPTAQGPEGLIHLDVVVKTTAGQSVLGLQADDFAIFDNGQPVQVLSFRGSPNGESVPLAVTVVLDTLRVPREVEAAERQELQSFLLKNDGRLPATTSLLLLTETGLWRVGQPSADGRVLAAALAHKRIDRWSAEPSSSPIGQEWRQSQAIGATGTVDGMRTDGPSATPADTALRALGAVAAAARRDPGRKALIWIGPAFNVASGASPPEPAGSKSERQAAFDKIVWFSGLLRLARMSVCDDAVPVPGFPPADSPAAANLPASALQPVSSPGDLIRISSQAGIPALNRRVLAIESGGVVIDGVDRTGRIEGCIRDASKAYTLTFNPAPAQHADEYHSLRVRLREAGLSAITNTGYYDEPYETDAPDTAMHRMTVTELDAFLRGAAGMTDADLARQLEQTRLTERASEARASAWTAQVRGRKAREALTVLVDLSAFLDPPPGEMPADPAPDPSAQRAMLARAAQYVHQSLPRLPNFFARRTEADYEEIPSFYKGGGRFSSPEALHQTDSSHTTVVFRNGGEVVDPKLLKRAYEKGDLRTYGTFGPVLGAVEDALSSHVEWSRWEMEASGERAAVFRYSIPAQASHSETGGCCRPEGDGNIGFAEVSGYHGEIALDPATGAVLRLLIDEDLDGFVPIDRGELMVTYGPVTIGEATYICPLHSISLLRARSVSLWSAWEGVGYRIWGPYATKLNDFRFDDYHLFRARVRILPGVTRTPE